MKAATPILLVGLAIAIGVAPLNDAEAATADGIAASCLGGSVTLHMAVDGVTPTGPTQLFLDTDLDASTGYAYDSGGFDAMIENGNLYRFTGSDRLAWSWRQVGAAAQKLSGDELTITFDIELLELRRANVVFRTLSDDYAAETMRRPTKGTFRFNAPELTPGTEATGDASDPAGDVLSFAAEQRGDVLEVRVELGGPAASTNVLVFFDADRDSATGYRPGLDLGRGFDLVVDAATLQEFSGKERDVWAWQGVSDVQRTVDGKTLLLRVPVGMLPSGELGAAAWVMSDDWQQLIDKVPDVGLNAVKIEGGGRLRTTAKEVPMSAPRPNRGLPPRERVARAKSFYTYYGSGQVAALSHFDVAVLHSPEMPAGDIAQLKALGVVTIGYITVGEDDKLRKGDGTGPGGYASWYFDEDKDGQPDQNSIWKSYFADANDAGWRADRVAEAKRLVEQEGYDGIFLDTIDTAQHLPHTKPGMVQLVRDLRAALPDSPIVLNQGFEMFDQLAPLGDAIMFESFTATYDFARGHYQLNTPNNLDWHTGRVERLVEPVLKKHPMPVLSLEYAPEWDAAARQAAFDRCATFGFLCATAPIHLDRVYVSDLEMVAKPDAKWRQRQATPERLSIVLDRAANGFPQGTRVLPSGSYGGYNVKTIIDGIQDREGLSWSEAAWASAEDGQEAWLEFRFPEPIAGGELAITWAKDSGSRFISQDYRVQVRAAGGDAWQTVAHKLSESQPISTCALPDKLFSALRIVQPADGGSLARPNLMWVAQVERRTD